MLLEGIKDSERVSVVDLASLRKEEMFVNEEGLVAEPTPGVD